MDAQTVRTAKNQSVVLARARSLVNTSVQDMQSGLWSYKTREDLRVLGAALNIAKTRGEKTKTRALTRRIRQVREGLGLQ